MEYSAIRAGKRLCYVHVGIVDITFVVDFAWAKK